MKSVNPRDYYHPEDAAALDQLRSIPGFTPAMKAFMSVFSETMIEGTNMATKLRLGPDQLPELYDMLLPLCGTLGITVPQLYLELDPSPNAYTYGDTKAFITITSGLLDYCDEEQLKAVIAHECGHIACHHVLYTTIASLLLEGGESLFNMGIASLPLKLAFYSWKRSSELSADRAAAICMGGSESVENIMIRLSGVSKSLAGKIDKNEFMKQAGAYQQIKNSSGWNKTLQYLAVMKSDHPFNTVRASEIHTWCASEQFSRIMKYLNEKDIAYTGRTCPKCGAPVDDGWKFCKKCGAQL